MSLMQTAEKEVKALAIAMLYFGCWIGGFALAVKQLFQQSDVHHLWANTLCLSGAFLVNNLLSVIQRYLGEGGLLRMFLSPLPDLPEGNSLYLSSKTITGGRG